MKKTPRWMIAVVAFLIPVLYVVSFGPACAFGRSSEAGKKWVGIIYQPLMKAAYACGRPGRETATRYSIFFGSPGSVALYDDLHDKVYWSRASYRRY
jgi:hypothetical protein